MQDRQNWPWYAEYWSDMADLLRERSMGYFVRLTEVLQLGNFSSIKRTQSLPIHTDIKDRPDEKPQYPLSYKLFNDTK